MKKQTFFPRYLGPGDISLISAMGCSQPEGEHYHHPEWRDYRQGKGWGWRQVSRHETFSLVASERYHATVPWVAYTKWEDYIKVNFRLRGRHTTVLDGFGEYDHDCPEVYIACGPPGMIK